MARYPSHDYRPGWQDLARYVEELLEMHHIRVEVITRFTAQSRLYPHIEVVLYSMDDPTGQREMHRSRGPLNIKPSADVASQTLRQVVQAMNEVDGMWWVWTEKMRRRHVQD